MHRWVLSILAGTVFAAFAIVSSSPVHAGTLLVANKSDDTLSFVSSESGKVLATLPTGLRPHEVAVSPDGKLAAVANYGARADGSTLTVVSVPDASVLRTIDLGKHRGPHGLDWLSDTRIVVTTEGSRSLLVVDAAKGEVARAVETDQAVSHMVAVTENGERAFVANIGSGTMTAIDLESGKKIRDIVTGDGAEGIAVRPGGKEVWVTNRGAGTLSVIDTTSLEALATIESPGFPIRIGFTPDGKRALVSCAMSGEVAAFDAATRREVARRKLDFSAVADLKGRIFTGGRGPVPVGLLVTADGMKAFVAATNADVVAILDPSTLELIGTVKAGREPDGMAYAD